MDEEKPTLEYEPQAERVKKPWPVYVLAAICAGIAFLLALICVAVILNRLFPSPRRWVGLLIGVDVAVSGAFAFYTFQAILRYRWPRLQRRAKGSQSLQAKRTQ